MTSGRFVLIAAMFFVDVRVRAESSHKNEDDCWGKQIPCAVQATDHKREWTTGRFVFVMAPGGLAQQRDEKTIQLVDGNFYVEIQKPVIFKTPYATAVCNGECKALIERKATELTVKCLEGEWTIRRLGEKKDYILSSGLKLTIGEVETGGVARMDFPQSLPWAPTVLEWSKMYTGSVELFKSDVTRYRAEWKSGVESAAQVHQQIAARAVASYEDGLAKERARRKTIEKEEATLRELFRKKNDIDP